jgi:negative regulator of flagellin synthesis FlgM
MIQGKLPIFILKNRNCRRLRLAKDKKKEGEAMRIGTYNMISQIYGNTGTKKTKTSGTTGSGSFLDQVSFSSMGKDMQTAKTALGNTPDVRESKIQDLKRRIDNATYELVHLF